MPRPQNTAATEESDDAITAQPACRVVAAGDAPGVSTSYVGSPALALQEHLLQEFQRGPLPAGRWSPRRTAFAAITLSLVMWVPIIWAIRWVIE
jgi:hypothetical protein